MSRTPQNLHNETVKSMPCTLSENRGLKNHKNVCEVITVSRVYCLYVRIKVPLVKIKFC